MVVIPAGEFMMGSPESENGRFGDEGPVHRVSVHQPFAIGKYEVVKPPFYVPLPDRVSGTGGRMFRVRRT
jgi:hypothetical protein